IPAVRDLTRWERFAKLKGIKNKKKSRKIWDPTTQSWRPRWGKDRINAPKDKWFIEVPDNSDPYEDQFAKLTKEKNERRAKNELQRLRNIARVVKPGQAPPVGVLSESQGSKNELSRALSIAKVSDASMGRFNAPVDERKISKKTEKKMKPRLKLSQVVGSKSTKKSAKIRKPPAKKKPMKKKGSRTVHADISHTGDTVIKVSGSRQPNSENSVFSHENFFSSSSRYQWSPVKHRLNSTAYRKCVLLDITDQVGIQLEAPAKNRMPSLLSSLYDPTGLICKALLSGKLPFQRLCRPQVKAHQRCIPLLMPEFEARTSDSTNVPWKHLNHHTRTGEVVHMSDVISLPNGFNAAQ
ncbi:regulator of ribosome biosynthesis, partial [Clonorchis sinensis]